MAENEIIVRVLNQVVGGPTVTLMGADGNEFVVRAGQVPQMPTSNSIAALMGARTIISSANRLISSFADPSFTQALNEIAGLALLTSRALAGDPVAILGLTVKLASDAISNIKKEATERAAALNQIDDARIRAGTLDLNRARVSINWFDGRYKYSRG